MLRTRRARSLVAFPLALSVTSAVAGACRFFDVAPPGADAGASAADAMTGPDGSALLPGLLSLEDGVRACSWVVSCPGELTSSMQLSFGVSIDPTNFAHCVDALAAPIDPDRLNAKTSRLLKCIASARSCDEAAHCPPSQFQRPPDPRCANDAAPANRCEDDGGTILFCDSATLSDTIDCTNEVYGPGSRCNEDLAGLGTKFPKCVMSAPCAPNSSQCLGTIADGCNDAGLHIQFDCAVSGRRCLPGSGCAGPACAGLTSTTCDGTLMTICNGSTATLVDCARVGGSCIKNNTTVACSRSGDSCGVFDDPRVDRCTDGSTLDLCFAGRRRSFACASVGLRCIPPTDLRSSYCGQ